MEETKEEEKKTFSQVEQNIEYVNVLACNKNVRLIDRNELQRWSKRSTGNRTNFIYVSIDFRNYGDHD